MQGVSLFSTRIENRSSDRHDAVGTSEFHWTCVKLQYFQPYFQVIYSTAFPEPSDLVSTILLEDIEQVIALSESTAFRLRSVQIISPVSGPAEPVWRIDSIEAAFRGVEARHAGEPQYAHLYVGKTGRILDAAVANHESELTDLVEIFRAVP